MRQPKWLDPPPEAGAEGTELRSKNKTGKVEKRRFQKEIDVVMDGTIWPWKCKRVLALYIIGWWIYCISGMVITDGNHAQFEIYVTDFVQLYIFFFIVSMGAYLMEEIRNRNPKIKADSKTSNFLVIYLVATLVLPILAVFFMSVFFSFTTGMVLNHNS